MIDGPIERNDLIGWFDDQMVFDGHECMRGPTWGAGLLGIRLRSCDKRVV